MQPIVDLADGRLAGVEALLRWRRGSAGRAAARVRAAGRGVRADRRDRALRAGRGVPAWRWSSRLCTASRSRSASTSRRGTRSRATCRRSVEHALRSTGFDPASLLVELTESERIEDVDRLANVLGAVRELGVSVALDDFGTGWSTLGLLRRVPFDVLKIDRSFTAGPAGQPQRSRARRGHRDARAQPRGARRRGGHRAARAARLAARGSAAISVRATCSRGRARWRSWASGWPRATRARSSRHSSAQSCLTFSQSASAGLRLGGRKRQPGKARRGRRERAALDQPRDVAAVDLVDGLVLQRILLEPEIGRVHRLLVHPPEQLRAQVLHPVGVQVHDAELAQRLDVDDAGARSCSRPRPCARSRRPGSRRCASCRRRCRTGAPCADARRRARRSGPRRRGC